MYIEDGIYFFSSGEWIADKKTVSTMSPYVQTLNALTAENMPILPAFVLSLPSSTHTYSPESLYSVIKQKMELFFTKEYGIPLNPFLLQISLYADYPKNADTRICNIGMIAACTPNIEQAIGKEGAAQHVLHLLQDFFSTRYRIAEHRQDIEDKKAVSDTLDSILHDFNTPTLSAEMVMERYAAVLPQQFFTNAAKQFDAVLQNIVNLYTLEQFDSDRRSIVIRPDIELSSGSTYGTDGTDNCTYRFFSRHTVTGEKKLQGIYSTASAKNRNHAAADIMDIPPEHVKKFEHIAEILEQHFKFPAAVEIRSINGKQLIIHQEPAADISTKALIACLVDLQKCGCIDAEYIIRNITAAQLAELTAPLIDKTSVTDYQYVTGGVAGSTGAAVGRVYFNSQALLDAQQRARREKQDDRCILCIPAAYAEDVTAIESAEAVISSEGGYASHAAVVARQYGKPALIHPDIHIQGNKAYSNGLCFSEGDYLTLDVPQQSESRIFFGKGKILSPNTQTLLNDLIPLIRPFAQQLKVYANADTPQDAEAALRFGADGIGLCRTEHLFLKLQQENMHAFRYMLFYSDAFDDCSHTRKIVTDIEELQEKAFYDMLRIMQGKRIVIRLLDAPLHEFLPANDNELEAFICFLSDFWKKSVSKEEVREHLVRSTEVNPMLGHRGCRMAISHAGIYAMQIRALFSAAYRLKKEDITADIDIMIPMIMNQRELKQIVYGKTIEGDRYDGIRAVEEQVRIGFGMEPLPYRIGAMIELPVAALAAGELARYAAFFSFGTNDLTQTTLGLSRDDGNTFLPAYSYYDLIADNPFRILDPSVQELIHCAVQRAKIVRPDIELSLCGEHGAIPENIDFCLSAGLQSVSCSPSAIPSILLAAAQCTLSRVTVHDTRKKE